MAEPLTIKTKASIGDICYFCFNNAHKNKQLKATVKHISIEVYKTEITVEYSVKAKDGTHWTIDESDLVV